MNADFAGENHLPPEWSLVFSQLFRIRELPHRKRMPGGGIKGGVTLGKTDDFGYNLVEDPVHVHDFHATVMHLLGVDQEKLICRSQGRDFRLTDVAGKIVKPLLT